MRLSKSMSRKNTFLKCVRCPSFREVYLLGKDHVICVNSKKTIEIQPNYLGFQILEMAKKAMYYFWYKVMKANYGDMVKILIALSSALRFIPV